MTTEEEKKVAVESVATLPEVLPSASSEQPEIAKINKDINSARTEIGELEKKLKEEIGKAVSLFDDKIDKKEIKTTEILAIFITLFTFISVNINIFTRVEDLHTAIFFLILLTSCFAFILGSMFMLISGNKKNWYSIFLIAISLIFMWGLLVATKYWNPKLNEVRSELKK